MPLFAAAGKGDGNGFSVQIGRNFRIGEAEDADGVELQERLVEGAEDSHGLGVAERVRQALVHRVQALDFVQRRVAG